MATEAQFTLFDLPEPSKKKATFRRLQHPIWTENKAKLIERYLLYFVLVTKHGTYIDGFAGPQKPEKPEMWAAKLVLESEPRWLQQFHLFEQNTLKYGYLKTLKESQPSGIGRNIQIYRGDFNVLLHRFLAKRPIRDREASFCLLDQHTFECHWTSVKALAQYKTSGMKIELFYFLPASWFGRALAAQKDMEVLKAWWGGDDWNSLQGKRPHDRAMLICDRFKKELYYEFVNPWPIYERQGGGRVMYHMIHATDHPDAPNLMYRAYHEALTAQGSLKQLEFSPQWKYQT